MRRQLEAKGTSANQNIQQNLFVAYDVITIIHFATDKSGVGLDH